MRLTENRRLAWLVLAACVLLSLFVLGGAALGRERGRVLKAFNDGTDTSTDRRMSMDAYLDDAAEAATVMGSEAELRLGKSDLAAAVLDNAGLVGNDSADLAARSKAFTELKSQVEKLYNDMYAGVAEADLVSFMKAYNDFWGNKDLIERDGYHKLAKGYNSLISSFPGGLVATVTRQGSLDTFGG